EPNRYLTDKVATEHFYERLQHLISRSVAFVALRGGMGTVTEVSLVWNKLQTRVIEPRPLILLGECWRPLLECWRRHIVISDEDISILDFALTAEEAVEIIMKKSALVATDVSLSGSG
ncbi:MAG: LOG family protein, partial [Pyrinomonadaceae bacterium]